MFQLYVSDLRRLLRLRSAWALYGLVLTIILISALKTQTAYVQSVYINIGADSFVGILSRQQSNQVANLPWQLFVQMFLTRASAVVQLAESAKQHSYLALAVSTVVGVFYAHKIASRYENLQASRGLSRPRIVAANALTIATYSLTIASAAVLVQLVPFYLTQPDQGNPLWTAMVAGEAVPYFPQLLMPGVCYLGVVTISAASTIFFLSALAYLSARVTRNFIAAVVLPVALVWLWQMIFFKVTYPLNLISYLTFDFVGYSIDSASEALSYPAGYLTLGVAIFAGLIGYSILATVLRTRHGRAHR